MIHPNLCLRLALIVAIVLTALSSRAEPGYTMPSTHMWEMTSESGEVYRIFVSYPAAEPPAEGYPELYVLDGNASFAGFAEARRIQERFDLGKSMEEGHMTVPARAMTDTLRFVFEPH